MMTTPEELEAWRLRCGFTKWEAAAAALGLSRSTMFRALARGRVDRTLALACEAVEARIQKGERL